MSVSVTFVTIICYFFNFHLAKAVKSVNVKRTPGKVKYSNTLLVLFIPIEGLDPCETCSVKLCGFSTLKMCAVWLRREPSLKP